MNVMSAIYASLAVTIAVRYCASRKQFGPNPQKELPVIEYQLQVVDRNFLKSFASLNFLNALFGTVIFCYLVYPKSHSLLNYYSKADCYPT